MLTRRIAEGENHNCKSPLWWSVFVLVGLLTLMSFTLSLFGLIY